jgi:hypothetical protein
MMADLRRDEVVVYLILPVFLIGWDSPNEASHGRQSTPAG